MKNIHILPTDNQYKGSISLTPDGRLSTNVLIGIPQHIYITVDEEIKEGDWCIHLTTLNISKHHSKDNNLTQGWNKIILTTDPDLIKDGVQAIDDEFLEWFVKNPSCDYVDVHIMNKGYNNKKDFPYQECYRIIIPKEEFTTIKGGNDIVFPSSTTITFKSLPDVNWESDITNKVWDEENPKQIYYNTVGRENGVNVVKGQFNTQKEALDLANELNRKFPDLYYDWRETLIKEEPKQIKCYCGHTITCDCEPLQETFEEFINQSNTPEGLDQFSYDKGLKDGAKWQQERMEKDMINFHKWAYQKNRIEECDKTTKELLKEWFAQFKKK
jgi:hypothetical protein